MDSAGQAKVGQSAGPQPPPAKPTQRPERTLTLLLVSTGITLAFIGSTVGALMLGELSGLPVEAGLSLFPSHPYLQIYGFIAQFVIGVDYSLLPRFKVGRLPAVFFGYAVYALTTAANVLFLLNSVFIQAAFPYDELGAILMLAGSLVFLSQVVALVVRPTGGFPEANPLIILSSVSLVLISFLLLFEGTGYSNDGDVFSPQLVYLALVGFAGSMIYAVEIRSVSFRQCDYRKRTVRLCSILQGLGIAGIFIGVVAGSMPASLLGAVLLLGAAVSQLVAIKALELAHPLMYRPAMTKMHFRIMRYNEVCILLAAAWLLFGSTLGIAWLGLGIGTFFVKDSFIHAIAIGFVGSTITCFAPMLLPGLLGHKGPATGLSFGPIAVLNVGVLVRILGNFQTLALQSPPAWESLSGALIIAAMVWFLVMLRGIGRPTRTALKKAATETFSLEQSKRIAEGRLTVTTRKTARDVTFPVWFVAREGSIYLLPVRGSSTNWFKYIVRNGRTKIDIGGQIFTGASSPIREGDKVKQIWDLFRDKYGDRNCKNFFDDRVDAAVRMSLE